MVVVLLLVDVGVVVVERTVVVGLLVVGEQIGTVEQALIGEPDVFLDPHPVRVATTPSAASPRKSRRSTIPTSANLMTIG